MSEEMFTFEEEDQDEEYIGKVKSTTKKTNKKINKKTNKKMIRQTFIITEDIKKALKIKAITEGVGLNDMMCSILTDVIEEKYFDNLE